MKYVTSLQAAESLGLTKRRINDMCLKGEISGAIKSGNRWQIPESYVEKVGSGKREMRPLPIGVSDFAMAITNYYYVDKTLLIKEILDERAVVSLFLRPRRFGKTLNMDMLRVFFESSNEDTSSYFEGTKIWEFGQKYMDYQGKFPVIYFTFKDMKYTTWLDMLINIKSMIQREFARVETINRDKLSDVDIDYIQSVLTGELSDALWPGTLGRLTEILDNVYGIPPIVMIDEYDTPMQQGHFYGFYDEIIGFMRNFLSGGLKDNKHLSMAFLTGILRVAKESIFSGLNNIRVNSVIDRKYSSYFGFTESEVKKLLDDYGVKGSFAEVKKWYDGYHFGDNDIYNPWSVLNYINEQCMPQTYWQSTGSNEIIGEVISFGTYELASDMKSLLNGESKRVYIDTAVVYPEVTKDSSFVYSFLLMGGYLTIENSETLYDGNTMADVRIPNMEIMYIFEKEILSRSDGIVSGADAIQFQIALSANDNHKMQKALQGFLRETISFHDAAAEGFYHGLLLGLSAALGRYYKLSSNREAGDGRYDIILVPRVKGGCAYIIEVKALKSRKKTMSELEIEKLLLSESDEAIRQIEDNRYADAVPKGVKVYGIGAAFYKKSCQVKGKYISR